MTKPVIVKRSVKGAALTFTELDTNFQNLDDATITLKAGSAGVSVASDLNGVITLVATDGITLTGNNTTKEIAIDASLVRDTTPQLGGALDVNGYKIISVSNGAVTLQPNGTGSVELNSNIVRVGPNTGYAYITSQTGSILHLSANEATNILSTSSYISIDGASGNIVFQSSGSNNRFLMIGDGIRLGKNGSAANITSDGINGHITIQPNQSGIATSSRITLNEGTDSNIEIVPGGTGDVQLVADTVVVGDAAAAAIITTNGTGNLTLSTNNGTNSGTIAIANGVNGNITLTPNGTGDIILSADTVQVGDLDTAATLTTNGAGNLTISTNNGTNSGTIVITQGANGNVTVTPNGTGVFNVSGNPSIATRTNSTGGSIIGRAQTTTGNTYLYPSINVQKVRTDILLAAMTAEPAVLSFSTRDSALVTNNHGRLACTYQGTGSNPFFRFSVSADNFSTEIVSAIFGGGVALWGSAGTYTHTTTGTTDLILSTNNGTNSGTIKINDGVNGNLELTPNGTGSVFIENSAGTDIADFNTSRVLTNVAIRGNVTTGATVSKGATYTIATTEKQYLELQITNTGAGSNVVLEVTNLTVSGTGGHYAVLIYNNSGSNIDLDILNNGITLTTASKNMPNGSRHICTIYCVGDYAAVEVMDAV